MQTVNVVAEVANFLHTFTTDGSDFIQINQIVQTLIEMCVGNPKNQQMIFDAVVVEPLNRILELDDFHDNKLVSVFIVLYTYIAYQLVNYNFFRGHCSC